MSLKENIKNNQNLYKILKPCVDEGRIIKESTKGFFRERVPVVRNENYKKLAYYNGIGGGGRCFVIANGPSLTGADLDMIADEKSLACNRIFTAFSETRWRPTYWACSDEKIVETVASGRPQNIPLFVTKACWDYVDGNLNNAVYIKDLYLKDHFCKTNMLSWWPMSATVAVFTIELAMYMGFKEIILLGYDCTFSVRGSRHAGNEEIYKQDDAFLEKDRNRLKDRHMSIEEYDKHLLNMIMSDYKSDREYAEKHGVKIWNATRGGRLEIFKRKQLEDFF